MQWDERKERMLAASLVLEDGEFFLPDSKYRDDHMEFYKGAYPVRKGSTFDPMIAGGDLLLIEKREVGKGIDAYVHLNTRRDYLRIRYSDTPEGPCYEVRDKYGRVIVRRVGDVIYDGEGKSVGMAKRK